MLAKELVYKKGFLLEDGSYTDFAIPGEDVDKKDSPHRVEPRCQFFGECGGCELQHINYEHQLELKSLMVKKKLSQAGIKREELKIYPSSAYGVRRKLVLHVSPRKELGFYKKGSRELVPIDRCEMAVEEINEQLLDNSQAEHGAQYILTAAPKVKVPLHNKYLEVPEQSFVQVNEVANEKMVQLVFDYIKSLPGKNLLDLYSGAGNFSFPFALEGFNVTAVEADKHLVRAAEKFSKELGVSISLVLQRVEKYLQAESVEKFDVVIADPPRLGLAKAVSAVSKAKNLILVSCELGAAIRDISELSKSMELVDIVGVDMFPQTSYVELISCFRK